jgi:hypothetical protein
MNFKIVGFTVSLLAITAASFAQRGHDRRWDNRYERDYHYERNYYSYRPQPARFSIVASLPFGAVMVSIGSNRYHYYEGVYYRPVASGYMIAEPPVGIIVPVLPPGYMEVIIGSRRYYTSADTYYLPMEGRENRYQVVEPPSTPKTEGPAGSYEKLVLEGKTYYRKGNTYYKASVDGNGEIIYVPVSEGAK